MKRSGFHLSDTYVKSLTKREGIFRKWDAEQRGFAIQITPKGQKSWIVQFTKPNKDKVSLTIGTYPSMGLVEARTEATRLYKIHLTGGDIRVAHFAPPMSLEGEKEGAHETTFREVAEEWWMKSKLRYAETTRQSYSSILNNVILNETKNEWWNSPIRSIEYIKIETLYDHERKRNPVQANRMIPILSKIFKHAEKYGFRDANTNYVKLIERTSEESRDRVLNKSEFLKFNLSISNLRSIGTRDCDQELSDVIADLFLFCAFSGLRPAEARKLKWSEIHEDIPKLSIDHKMSKKTKRKKELPLNTHLLKIINKRKAYRSNDFVFSGRVHDSCIVGYARPWEKSCKRAKLKDFHLHDFRRIWRSRCLELGYPDSVADVLLGHSLGKVRGAYTNLEPTGIVAKASQQISDWVFDQMNTPLKSKKNGG